MLVLHRRPRERVAIIPPGGDVIWLEVTECGRSFARLGLTAPQEVRILREELFRSMYPDAEVPRANDDSD